MEKDDTTTVGFCLYTGVAPAILNRKAETLQLPTLQQVSNVRLLGVDEPALPAKVRERHRRSGISVPFHHKANTTTRLDDGSANLLAECRSRLGSRRRSALATRAHGGELR